MKNKRIISILVACLLIVTMACPAMAVSHQDNLIDYQDCEKEYADIVERQAPIIALYEQIIGGSSMPRSASFKYGGAWIDEDFVHINVVGDLKDGANFYSSKCYATDKIKFHSVEYSLDFLIQLVKDVVSTNNSNIISAGVDEIKNLVVVGIDESLIAENNLKTESAKEQFLVTLKTEISESLYVTSNKDLYRGINDLPITLAFESKVLPSIDLTGGIPINGSNRPLNGDYSISLGMCGTYWNSEGVQVPVLLTCGHGRTVGEDFYTNISGSFRKIGTVIAKQYMGGQYYDYSVVKITATSVFSPTNSVNNVSLTSEATSHPVGAVVSKYGRNGYAYGTITRTNCSMYVPLDTGTYDYVYGMVDVNIASSYIGMCGGGDSGCTIYSGNKFYGLYSADNRTDTSEATHFYYTPSYGISGFDL